MRSQDAFEADGGYVCPKCRSSLRGIGVDFARVGVLYRCGDCDVLVDWPDRRVVCEACSEDAEHASGPEPEAVTIAPTGGADEGLGEEPKP